MIPDLMQKERTALVYFLVVFFSFLFFFAFIGFFFFFFVNICSALARILVGVPFGSPLSFHSC